MTKEKVMGYARDIIKSIKERLDQRPVCMDEQPVRPAAWTLDVEFGYFEVHVGDGQTGPIGDKLSLMVGRLIA
jgi:hypothetical protein